MLIQRRVPARSLGNFNLRNCYSYVTDYPEYGNLQLLSRAISRHHVLRSVAQAREVLFHEHHYSVYHTFFPVLGGISAAPGERREDNLGAVCSSNNYCVYVDGGRQDATDFRVNICHQ